MVVPHYAAASMAQAQGAMITSKITSSYASPSSPPYSSPSGIAHRYCHPYQHMYMYPYQMMSTNHHAYNASASTPMYHHCHHQMYARAQYPYHHVGVNNQQQQQQVHLSDEVKVQVDDDAKVSSSVSILHKNRVEDDDDEEHQPYVAVAEVKVEAMQGCQDSDSGSKHTHMVDTDRECIDGKEEEKTPYALLHHAERSRKWLDMYEELKTFKAQHGHVLVPYNYNEIPKLGSWVKTQRYAYRVRKSTMTTSRIEMLEQLGFDWDKSGSPVRGPCSSNSKGDTFKRGDDTDVPMYPSNKGKKARKSSKSKLDSQSITNNQQWHRNFQELIRYKEKHGDCLVAQSYPRLGEWIHTQRKQYRLMKQGRASRMTTERIQRLESVGFVWHVERFRIPQRRKEPSQEEVQRLNKVFGSKRRSSWQGKERVKMECPRASKPEIIPLDEESQSKDTAAILSTYSTLSVDKGHSNSPTQTTSSKRLEIAHKDLDVAMTITSLLAPSGVETPGLTRGYIGTPTNIMNPPSKKMLLRRCTPDCNETNIKSSFRSSPTTVLISQTLPQMKNENKPKINQARKYPVSKVDKMTQRPVDSVENDANDSEDAIKSLGYLLLAMEQVIEK